jgi:hypothetical protein
MLNNQKTINMYNKIVETLDNPILYIQNNSTKHIIL